MLAALLAAGGTVVSSDRLVEALWGDDAPANPVAALHNQVSRLRRLLAGPGRWDLMTEAEGYRLVAAGDDLDAARFERLVAEAGELADSGDEVTAVVRYDEALRLWRGEPYGELADRECVQSEAARLNELWVQAREAHAGVLVALGRTTQAVLALEALANDHPLRSGLTSC
ncbi:MAG: winged helix-turn-helix domain-containing protein [Actinomycetota bacterium]|nr:winged helix-turn-helix domain-containing protein [Actinomycetota bacterium]